ncbi:MAG: hypothetical protein ABI830_11575 [Pseudolabrys sp.]
MRANALRLLASVFVLGVSQGAFATDMPARMPAKAFTPVSVWNWTGFYAGVYAGVGINQSHAIDPVTPRGDIEFLGTGFTGGATAGYNRQFARNWVAGIEGDIGYLGLSHDVVQYDDSLSTNQKTSWLGTVRGRLGYTSGPTLSYITGGAAFLGTKDVFASIAPAATSSSEKTRAGFAIGSGVETRLGGNWTAKSEYLYVDVGRGDTLTGVFGPLALQTDQHRYAMQRFGVNYLFGDRPNAPLPQYNWNGFYAGVLGGSAISQTKLTDSPDSARGGEFGNHGNGYSFGGTAGFNWQFAPAWVAGVEGDVSWLGINHSVNDYNQGTALYNLNTKWFATARGRIGYSTGPALLYVTGGGAWVNYNESWDFGLGTVSSTKTLSGYTVGGGIETMFSLFGPGWTTKSEYLFVNVGKGDSLNDPSTAHITADHQFHLFRSALLYHFGR